MTTLNTSALELMEGAGCDSINRSQRLSRRPFSYDLEVGADAAPRLLRVLVVDDDHDTTDMLGMLVRRWGHDPRLAYEGRAAIETAVEQRPDVVLLDIQMPRIDGYEIARQLRRELPQQKCLLIAVTGWADELRREQCSEAGMDLVLLKPVDPSILETLLMLESTRINRTRSDDVLV